MIRKLFVHTRVDDNTYVIKSVLEYPSIDEFLRNQERNLQVGDEVRIYDIASTFQVTKVMPDRPKFRLSADSRDF